MCPHPTQRRAFIADSPWHCGHLFHAPRVSPTPPAPADGAPVPEDAPPGSPAAFGPAESSSGEAAGARLVPQAGQRSADREIGCPQAGHGSRFGFAFGGTVIALSDAIFAWRPPGILVCSECGNASAPAILRTLAYCSPARPVDGANSGASGIHNQRRRLRHAAVRRRDADLSGTLDDPGCYPKGGGLLPSGNCHAGRDRRRGGVRGSQLDGNRGASRRGQGDRARDASALADTRRTELQLQERRRGWN
jgi:hypothetical protein